jgi:alpha-glucosidase
MTKFICKGFFWALPMILLVGSSLAQSSYDLKSPDNRIEVRIRTANQLRYDVLLRGTEVLHECVLSMDIDHQQLGMDPKVLNAKPSTHDDVVTPVVRQKFAKIRDHYNELRLNMAGGYSVVFRAYNEGAAYRFETSLPQSKVKVFQEESTFNFPSNFIVYYPQEDSIFTHNERQSVPQQLSEIAPQFIATLPEVVDLTGGAKLAISDSGL